MFQKKKIIRFRLYIFFLLFVLFFIKFSTTSVYANTYKIIDLEISESYDLNFNKQNKQKYAIQTIEKDVQLKLINVWPGLAIIVFKGNWNLKKVQVFRKFLIKNFETIFPRIKIRLQ